eukprot:554943-Alexandrium_andersonii.AAC.1
MAASLPRPSLKRAPKGKAKPKRSINTKKPAAGLGDGWSVYVKTRKGGKSAGHVDRYYISPSGK